MVDGIVLKNVNATIDCKNTLVAISIPWCRMRCPCPCLTFKICLSSRGDPRLYLPARDNAIQDLAQLKMILYRINLPAKDYPIPDLSQLMMILFRINLPARDYPIHRIFFPARDDPIPDLSPS